MAQLQELEALTAAAEEMMEIEPAKATLIY